MIGADVIVPADNEFDVVVVGFGAAGACAAIAAAESGARVLVVDRSVGGGATALSGGVVYSGGGTRYQRAAGFDDTPDNMFNYLRQEVDGAVDDETLRRFCAESVHRYVAKGMGSGLALYRARRHSAEALGVQFLPLTRAEELVMANGRVAGVRGRTVTDCNPLLLQHYWRTTRF